MFLSHLVCAFAIWQLSSANILVLPTNGGFVEEEFRDMPASFGNGLPYAGLHGMVRVGIPSDGCSQLQPPPKDVKNFMGKWIVLVARYNCTFEQKVRFAQNSSYDAVIVHNVKSDELETMSAKNSSGIHIPSVFVGESAGIILKLYSNNPDYFVIVNSEMPFNINTHLLLPFAIVVGICFIVMVVFMVVKYVRDRRRQRRERMSSSALNKIPIRKFEKGDPYETCAICLEDYVASEKLRILPCAHAYHSKCIDPWLTKNKRVCPVCKRKVFAHDERPYSLDTDSDTDTDDSTPLLRGANRTTQGGTFTNQLQNREPEPSPNDSLVSEEVSYFRRFLRRVSAPISRSNYIPASDQTSINGDQSSDIASDSTSDSLINEVQTRPGTSTTSRDVIV